MSARTPKPLFPWRKPAPSPAAPTPLQIGEKLVDAVNSAASTVAALHVAFMALTAYLAVIAWGTSHRDLLLDKPVKLPLVDVDVELTSFFGATPLLYVLVHLNLLIQFNLLARKLWTLVAHGKDFKLLADRLFVFPFVQYLLNRAGPLLHQMLAVAVFLTVIGLPWSVLLFMQVRFLPYQSEIITDLQRTFVWLDVILVLTLWPRVAARPTADTGYPRWRDGFRPQYDRETGTSSPWIANICALLLSMAVLIISVAAMVPGIKYEVDDKKNAVALRVGFEGWLVDLLDRSSTCGLLADAQVVVARYKENLKNKGSDESIVSSSASNDKLLRLTCSYGVVHTNKDYAEQRGMLAGRVGPTLRLTAFLFDLEKPVATKDSLQYSRFSPAFWFPDRYLDLQDQILVKGDAGADVQHALKGDLNSVGLDVSALGGERDKNGDEHVDGDFYCRQMSDVSQFSCFAKLRDWLMRVQGLKLHNRNLLGARLVRVIMPLVELTGSQVAGANFSDAQLQGANLEGVQLQGVRLEGAQFQGVHFGNAQLQNAILSRVKLQGIVLSGAQLQGAVLDGANLKGAQLDGADLQGASLLKVDLQGANLQGANLQGANLQGAKLYAALLQGASFDKAQLQNTNLKDMQFPGAHLNGAQLQGAVLDGANLKGAQLGGADLQRASLLKADLQGANLQGANLQGVELYAALLQGASFDKAQLQNTNLKDVQFPGVNLNGAQLQGAVLDGANLKGAKLDSANLQGASLKGANLQLADLQRVEMQAADLRKASAQGANFNNAQLLCAWFNDVRAQGAVFISATLYGAHFDGIYLQGAILDGAKMQGVTFSGARLDAVSWFDVELGGSSGVVASSDGAVVSGNIGLSSMSSESIINLMLVTNVSQETWHECSLRINTVSPIKFVNMRSSATQWPECAGPSDIGCGYNLISLSGFLERIYKKKLEWLICDAGDEEFPIEAVQGVIRLQSPVSRARRELSGLRIFSHLLGRLNMKQCSKLGRLPIDYIDELKRAVEIEAKIK